MSNDEIIEVVKAASNGKRIECHDKDNPQFGWRYCPFPNWDFYRVDFRVEEKPREWILRICTDGTILTNCHPYPNGIEFTPIKVREVIE